MIDLDKSSQEDLNEKQKLNNKNDKSNKSNNSNLKWFITVFITTFILSMFFPLYQQIQLVSYLYFRLFLFYC